MPLLRQLPEQLLSRADAKSRRNELVGDLVDEMSRHAELLASVAEQMDQYAHRLAEFHLHADRLHALVETRQRYTAPPSDHASFILGSGEEKPISQSHTAPPAVRRDSGSKAAPEIAGC